MCKECRQRLRPSVLTFPWLSCGKTAPFACLGTSACRPWRPAQNRFRRWHGLPGSSIRHNAGHRQFDICCCLLIRWLKITFGDPAVGAAISDDPTGPDDGGLHRHGNRIHRPEYHRCSCAHRCASGGMCLHQTGAGIEPAIAYLRALQIVGHLLQRAVQPAAIWMATSCTLIRPHLLLHACDLTLLFANRGAISGTITALGIA